MISRAVAAGTGRAVTRTGIIRGRKANAVEAAGRGGDSRSHTCSRLASTPTSRPITRQLAPIARRARACSTTTRFSSAGNRAYARPPRLASTRRRNSVTLMHGTLRHDDHAVTTGHGEEVRLNCTRRG